jgi:acyl-CoA synthetase (AMP-forming)/AMP-acid ligase II
MRPDSGITIHRARHDVNEEVAVDGLHTLGRWTRDAADRTPDRIAIDDGSTRVSYAELDARAERLALVLRRYPPGSRIATLTGNSADHVVLFFACAKARLVLVPLSWRLSAREIAAQLATRHPRWCWSSQNSPNWLMAPIPSGRMGSSRARWPVPWSRCGTTIRC